MRSGHKPALHGVVVMKHHKKDDKHNKKEHKQPGCSGPCSGHGQPQKGNCNPEHKHNPQHPNKKFPHNS